MSSAIANGRPRKQLSDQLDRLDGIIDCLADGLTGAVRDAVRDGARAALKDLLVDALRDPETLASLRRALGADQGVNPTTPVASTRTHAFRARVRAAASHVANLALTAARAITHRVHQGWMSVRRTARTVGSTLAFARHLKAAVALGLTVGLTAVAVALVSHPAAVVLSGLGTAVAGFAVHLGLWARGVARSLTV